MANPEKVSGRTSIEKAIQCIEGRGLQVMCDPVTAEMLKQPDRDTLPDAAGVAHRCDLLLVFGGDGTMLRVAREVAGVQTPILGINVGGLGFLTAVSTHNLTQALEQIWKGEFEIEPRTLIEASGTASGKQIRHRALNDFVISRGIVSRLIEIEVCVDDQVLTCYRCDGLIVSSPTGSTAYSMAAGGAIISPSAEVFALTPICPHTLSIRSVIVSLQSIVKVKIVSQKLETILAADGQMQTNLSHGDEITVRRSDKTIQLLRLHGSSFFETLRQKLHWRGSHI